jgi:hypothetical protein
MLAEELWADKKILSNNVVCCASGRCGLMPEGPRPPAHTFGTLIARSRLVNDQLKEAHRRLDALTARLISVPDTKPVQTKQHHVDLADAGSGCCLRAAEPFVETDAAEARLGQRHERVLLDPAAEVSGLEVAHDHTRVADRLQIAGDDFVERRSFRAGDLDDAVSRRRERHIGNDGSNVVRRDGLEQAGRKPDYVSIRGHKPPYR